MSIQFTVDRSTSLELEKREYKVSDPSENSKELVIHKQIAFFIKLNGVF
ncbi:uncharacterized protein METZ01_LOCUS126409 [marine metagenome]|uniref:Uncharacterized protein n=1 Tax=marine metagenome TaxID=408172 RepID=A0A381Y994_9ZZZZ